MTQQHLTLQLLGTISITLNGKPIKQLSTRAAEALVIYILHQPRPVPREQLADMFFQASEPKQAAANLRAMLSQIKKKLNPFIEITRYAVGRRTGSEFRADSLQFSQQLTAGSEQLTVEELQSALENYHGDFLAGFHLRDAPEFEQWALVERERLRLLAIEGLQRLMQIQERNGDFRGALVSAEKLLSIEPLLESVHRTKMLMLARTGQRALALRHFKTAEQIFADELGIALSATTVALHDRIHSLPDQPAHNLPALRGEFIGRKSEVAALLKLLARPERRLVTLLGMGGIGKTRLSQQVGYELQQSGIFLDGVQFVSLVGVESAEQLPVQIATTLGLALLGQNDPVDQLIAHLQKRELLLILDNFEQLVDDAASFLSQILTDAPQVKLLVTSRERLSLYEETVFDVEPLPVSTAAIELFVSHAQRQQVGFLVESADILPICQLLDGVPLAIELAASLVRQHSHADIAAQIQHSLDVLATTFRNLPPRHRSIRAAFETSWQRLTPATQQLYAQLAIFRGGFTLDAAQTICNASSDALNQLMEKSLLTFDGTRYHIHELMRQYAMQKLPSERHDSLQETFTTYFAQFLQAQWLPIQQADYQEAQEVISCELSNIAAAERWILQNIERATRWLQQMLPTLRYYYYLRGPLQSGQQFFERVAKRMSDAEVLESAEQRSVYAQAYIWMAFFSFGLGQYDLVDAILRSRLPDVTGTERGLALLVWGKTNILRGQREKAEQQLRESLSLLTTQSDRADALKVLGVVCVDSGRYAEAITLYKQSLTIYEALGYLPGVCQLKHNIGTAYSRQGLREQARPYYEAALKSAEQANFTKSIMTSLSALGSIARARGDLDQALDYGQRSLSMAIERGEKRWIAACYSNITQVYLAMDEIDMATTYWQKSLRQAWEIGSIPDILLNFLLWVQLQQKQNQLENALKVALFLTLQTGLRERARRTLEELLPTLEVSAEVHQQAQQWADAQSTETVLRFMNR